VSSLQHPFSRGTIHINSADPFALPSVDPRYFSKEVDVQIAVQGFKFLRKVAATAPYKDYIVAEVSPGPSVQTDEDVAQWVKNGAATEYHPLGTAAMLPLADRGVVDVNCKVYGTKNLRVVDASIIPMEPSAHLQNTVYALALKCHDKIAGK
jgi:choline dehydrogenase